MRVTEPRAKAASPPAHAAGTHDNAVAPQFIGQPDDDFGCFTLPDVRFMADAGLAQHLVDRLEHDVRTGRQMPLDLGLCHALGLPGDRCRLDMDNMHLKRTVQFGKLNQVEGRGEGMFRAVDRK